MKHTLPGWQTKGLTPFQKENRNLNLGKNKKSKERPKTYEELMHKRALATKEALDDYKMLDSELREVWDDMPALLKEQAI